MGVLQSTKTGVFIRVRVQPRASVAGVGITSEDVMDAPMGPADDPVWQQAFWYRGSAVPGSASTALIAGHVSGPRGRPGAFARVDDLRPGDSVVVHDARNGLPALRLDPDAVKHLAVPHFSAVQTSLVQKFA